MSPEAPKTLKDGRSRTALVSGGATGIGYSIVSRLLYDGYNVAFFSSNEGRVRDAKHRLLSAGFSEERILAKCADLKNSSDVGTFFEAVAHRFGWVDTYVNNAGISPKDNGKRIPLHLTTDELWSEVQHVNLTSAFLGAKHVLPRMIENQFGRIIFVGSIAARVRPKFAGGAYVASKAGLHGLTRAIATEYAEYGITANTVAPGNIATDMTGGPASPQNLLAVKTIPAGRIGVPDDLAGIVAFLSSEEAGFINGTTIDVTGAEYILP